MLQVRNVTIIQKKDEHVLVENLSFVLNDGEKAALIGEEGNGKSTLLKWIVNPSLVEPYADVSGEKTGSNVIGYLAQELVGPEAGTPIYEWLKRNCSFPERSPKAVSRVVKELGIPSELLLESRPLGTLSGGERIKVQLAALLLKECDLLLLDEPSNDLDLDTIEWLEGFLGRTEKSVLFVSHDETLIERTADFLIHIELVRRKTIPRVTVSRLPYRTYIGNRERAFRHQAQVSEFEHAAYQKKKDRYLSVYQAVEHAQNTISRADPAGGRLLKKKMHSVQSLGKRLEKEASELTEQPEAEWAILPKFEEGVFVKNGKTVLDLHLSDLTADGRVLASNLKLRVIGPEHICIIGKNGCGKSTLLKEIARQLLPRTDLSVGYMPQNYEDLLDPSLSPIAYLAPDGEKSAVTKARIYLGSMKYTAEEAEHPMRQLSGGQRAKILLLKLILDRNNVLILDEPTRNFSPLSAPAVRTLLRSFRGAIIAVSHDRKYLEEVASTVYRMDQSGLVRI